MGRPCFGYGRTCLSHAAQNRAALTHGRSYDERRGVWLGSLFSDGARQRRPDGPNRGQLPSCRDNLRYNDVAHFVGISRNRPRALRHNSRPRLRYYYFRPRLRHLVYGLKASYRNPRRHRELTVPFIAAIRGMLFIAEPFTARFFLRCASRLAGSR